MLAKPTLEVELKDGDSTQNNTVTVRIEIDEKTISLCPVGYGDFSSAEGHGCPAYLELYNGKLRLVTFPNINDQNPVVVELDFARECLFQGEK